MKYIVGNIFDYRDEINSAICIPTNGIVKKDGTAVMGAGLAKAAVLLYPGSDQVLGALINKKGNITQQFWKNPNLISFPTKNHWKDFSSLSLIEDSCIRLLLLQNKKKFDKIYLPKVGTGHGALDFIDVEKVLAKYLTEDVYLIVDLK